MKMSWKGWAAVACLAVAASPAFAQKADSLVVDGNDWTSATAAERRAVLVGAANVVIADDRQRDHYAPCPCGSGRKFHFCHGALEAPALKEMPA
jgi:hypothetical protein